MQIAFVFDALLLQQLELVEIYQVVLMYIPCVK